LRKRPLTAAYCFLSIFFFGLYWSEKVQARVEKPVQYDMRLAARSTIDIKDVLGVIGHGVTVSSVEDRLGRYFGAECLINRIDRICREHPDPWEAARTVADELHNVDADTAYRVVPARVWLDTW
jgi:hypothetical protein